MTSLRERFIDAEKRQKEGKKAYNQLETLSGQLAGFAATLPKVLEDLVIRAEAGQPIQCASYAPAVHMTFKSEYYAPYTSDYKSRRTFPGLDEMQELQGYRKLLETCADPANDVRLRMAFSRPDKYSGGILLTVDIMINEPFADSTLYTKGPNQQEETHAIGATYIETSRKHFKGPAMLKLSGTA